MANDCVSPKDTFWTECKIVSASDYNEDSGGFCTPGSTYTESHNSDSFISENIYQPNYSTDLYGNFTENERLKNVTTKEFLNYQTSIPRGYTKITSAFPIYKDVSACTLSHATDSGLLNGARCPLAPVTYNYDNVQNCTLIDFNKTSKVPHLHSNYGLLEATHETRNFGNYSQCKGFSNVKQTIPSIDNASLLPKINSSLSLERNVQDYDRLHTLSADASIEKGKKLRRHIPHYMRPQDFVERRNSRERKRIGNVNDAFEVLRRHIPSLKQKEGASKINILRFAAEYIKDLGSLL